MLVKLFTIFVGNVILSSMKFGTILLVVYIVCVVSWILIISLQKNVKNKYYCPLKLFDSTKN